MIFILVLGGSEARPVGKSVLYQSPISEAEDDRKCYRHRDTEMHRSRFIDISFRLR